MCYRESWAGKTVLVGQSGQGFHSRSKNTSILSVICVKLSQSSKNYKNVLKSAQLKFKLFFAYDHQILQSI